MNAPDGSKPDSRRAPLLQHSALADGSNVQAPSEDAALRAIVEGVEAATGERFFALLVRHLVSALGVQYAFVSELSHDRQRFRTLASGDAATCSTTSSSPSPAPRARRC